MIKIESFENTDFDRLISWIGNEELLIQFAGPIFTFPLTTEQLETYKKDKNRFIFKIVKLDADEIIGHSEIYFNGEKTARLCRILIGDKKYRGQGLGQQIIEQLVDYSFDKFNVSVVELNVYDWNISAIKCYEKVGFEINPYKSNTIKVNNNIWRSLQMTLDKTKWKQRNSKLAIATK